MERHEFLSALHELLRPRTYLEVGLDDGYGLSLSHAKSVGIDPDYHITRELRGEFLLARRTSDEFFAGDEASEFFAGIPLDLAFIDGMHHAEFAFRDFVNIERLCGPGSLVVFDDMLPRNHEEASRVRTTDYWTGDVFKVAGILRELRPELAVIPVDTEPTGTLIVVGLDPTSTTLADAYDELLPLLTSADPQVVPPHILERTNAANALALLRWPGWRDLIALRAGTPAPDASRRLASAFSSDFA
jgi:predicted O-methyltransferase YrrM